MDMGCCNSVSRVMRSSDNWSSLVSGYIYIVNRINIFFANVYLSACSRRVNFANDR